MSRMHHFFDQGWRKNPTGIAYVSATEKWTFNEAGEFSCQIGQALAAAGLSRDAKVAVLSPNSAVAWLSVIGIWRSGLVWVPLNPANPVEDNVELLKSFDCEALIFHSSLEVAAKAIHAALPSISLYVSTDGECDLGPSLEKWIAHFPPTTPVIQSAIDDVVAIMPTGGTTGRPKGVMNTHRSFATAFAHMLMAFHYDETDRVVALAAAPMTHTSGVLSMPATSRGGTVVIIERAESAAVVSAIEAYGVTELFLPPTVIYRTLDFLDGQKRDFSTLRYFIYGAAPMSVDKLRDAFAVFGPVMTELYGQTEAPAAITFLRPEEQFIDGGLAPASRLSSCGRPYPLIQVEIRDGDRIAGPGEAGEICVRGDLLMKGYYKDPVRTAEVIIDGWLHTGDIGHLDDAGYLHITDRKKDMIISGGMNIYPGEIEQVLWGHSAVRECAVIGVPDSDWGERVIAVVELTAEASITEEELRIFCRKILGGVKAPKQIKFVPELPRSVNGKVLKREVRAAYWSEVGRAI